MEISKLQISTRIFFLVNKKKLVNFITALSTQLVLVCSKCLQMGLKSKSSYQWLVWKCEWTYKRQSLKYVLKSLDGYQIGYTLLHREELTFSIVKVQFYYIVNAIHQPYINPKLQPFKSRLFSMFIILCAVKPDN